MLTGTALLREREHGTLEHLLVLPLTALEIMLAKVWTSVLVVVLCTWLSLELIVKKALGVPLVGSMGPVFDGDCPVLICRYGAGGVFNHLSAVDSAVRLIVDSGVVADVVVIWRHHALRQYAGVAAVGDAIFTDHTFCQLIHSNLI